MTDNDRDRATGGSTGSGSTAVPPTTEARLAAAPDTGWAGLIGDSDVYAAEWDRIEVAFVDDPRRAVEQADRLVGEVIQALNDSFRDTRSRLEQQWGEGAEVSTEDLRLTLQRYRAFFARLLPH